MMSFWLSFPKEKKLTSIGKKNVSLEGIPILYDQVYVWIQKKLGFGSIYRLDGKRTTDVCLYIINFGKPFSFGN